MTQDFEAEDYEACGESRRDGRNRGKRDYRHRRVDTGQWFQCVHCGQSVVQEAYGTEHRNHCNWCLWSRHVDDTPGDRASECRSAMEPISVWVRQKGEWAILHRCRGCGEIHSNRIAGDDDPLALMSLAVRPLSQPPFPLERLHGDYAAVAGTG